MHKYQLLKKKYKKKNKKSIYSFYSIIMENVKTYIYVLLLEKNKIFIHASSSINTEDIFNEYKMLYDLSLKYSPLKILDSIIITPCNQLIMDSYSHSTKNLMEKNPTIFLLDINKYVKQYMILYGLDNVRGGNYTDECLDENTMNFLKKEINIDNFSEKQEILQQYNEYKNNTQMDNTFEREEQTKILFDYEKYTILKNKYITLKKINDNTNFDTQILNELEWLYKISKESGYFTYREAPENKERYKKIVLLIKELRKKYEEIVVERYDQQNNSPHYVYMKNPEFLFDNYFYHQKKNVRQFLSEKDGEKIWELFELLYYTIYNRLQELEFDLSYFPKNIGELVAIKNRDFFHTPESVKGE